MKRYRTLFGIIIGTLLVLLGYVYFITFYEPVTEWKETGYQGEAARNPLLAAQRLLKDMGIPVRSVRFLTVGGDLGLGQHDTLVLWQENSNVRLLQVKPILEWVAAGGHLIMSGSTYQYDENDPDEPDPLFAAFRVQMYLSSQEGQDAENINESEKMAYQDVDIGGKVLTVRFNPSFYLTTERTDSTWRIPASEGAYLLHFPHGTGSISLVTDLNAIDNLHIGAQDNAEFFWHLLHYSGEVKKVWLLVPGHTAMPPLWQMLWQRAWPFWIASTLLILLLLWRAGSRFGPLLSTPPNTRRRLLEHIDAGGRLLWNIGQARHLHHAVVQSLWERLEVRRPDWRHLPHPELVLRLAELSGIHAAEVAKVLHVSESASLSRRGDEMEFTRQIRVLSKLLSKV